MGHIGILVVAVRRLSHSPMGIRTSKLPFFKLPRLKLPSSSRSYTEQYHTKLIRLSEACPRVPDGYTFIYRLVPARGHPRFGSLRPSSNRLPEPDLAAPLPSIEGTYSRCFLCLALSRRGLNYRRWALSRRGFRVSVGNRGDGNLRLHRADRAGAR